MAKIDKKIAKLEERIAELNQYIQKSLGKKDSRTDEINVPKTMEQIKDLTNQLNKMKDQNV